MDELRNEVGNRPEFVLQIRLLFVSGELVRWQVVDAM